MASKFNLTITVEDDLAIQACTALKKSGELDTLVSLLVDIEIARYISGEAFEESTPAHKETGVVSSSTGDFSHLWYDIKEAVEELKDIMNQSQRNPIEQGMADVIFSTLGSYGVAKKDDVSTIPVGVVAHPSAGNVPLQGSVQLSQESAIVEVPTEVKSKEPSPVKSEGLKSKLGKLKKMKGG